MMSFMLTESICLYVFLRHRTRRSLCPNHQSIFFCLHIFFPWLAQRKKKKYSIRMCRIISHFEHPETETVTERERCVDDLSKQNRALNWYVSRGLQNGLSRCYIPSAYTQNHLFRSSVYRLFEFLCRQMSWSHSTQWLNIIWTLNLH